MNIRKTNEMPTEGQFAALWNFNGGLWCATFKYKHGCLHRYDSNEDGWRPDLAPVPVDGAMYFVYVDPSEVLDEIAHLKGRIAELETGVL